MCDLDEIRMKKVIKEKITKTKKKLINSQFQLITVTSLMC